MHEALNASCSCSGQIVKLIGLSFVFHEVVISKSDGESTKYGGLRTEARFSLALQVILRIES